MLETCVERLEQLVVELLQKAWNPFSFPGPSAASKKHQIGKRLIKLGRNCTEFSSAAFTAKIVQQIGDLIFERIKLLPGKLRWAVLQQLGGMALPRPAIFLARPDNPSGRHHVNDDRMAGFKVAFEEPVERLWIMNECFEGNAVFNERLPPCPIKLIEDDDQVDVGVFRALSANNRARSKGERIDIKSR